MKQGRETTLEERIQIVRECIACGKNYGEMALKYKVSYQQVRTWTLRFEEMGEIGLEDRRGERKISQTPRSKEEELEKRIAELEHENHLLKLECELRKKWKNWKGGIAETVSSGTAVRSRSPLYG